MSVDDWGRGNGTAFYGTLLEKYRSAKKGDTHRVSPFLKQASAFAPPDEALVNTAPFPIIWRQVAPRCPGTQHPKHRIDEPTVILRDSSPLSTLSWQMRFQYRPCFIAYVMPMIGCFHFLSLVFPCFFLFYHKFSILCRHYLALHPVSFQSIIGYSLASLILAS